jgi:hypothetical protein
MSEAEILSEIERRNLDDFESLAVIRWFNRDARTHDDWILSGEIE